tara:strand:+ start:245 stop:472 length:228 start_codon:yes stop_codon:yes gene_type:complete
MKNTIKFYDTIFSTSSVFATDINKVYDKNLFSEYEGKIKDSYRTRDKNELIYVVNYSKGEILVPEKLIKEHLKKN